MRVVNIHLASTCFNCSSKICIKCFQDGYKIISNPRLHKRYLCFTCCNTKTHVHYARCTCFSCTIRCLPPCYENDRPRPSVQLRYNVSVWWMVEMVQEKRATCELDHDIWKCFGCPYTWCRLCNPTRPKFIFPRGLPWVVTVLCDQCSIQKTHVHTGVCGCLSCRSRNLPPVFNRQDER